MKRTDRFEASLAEGDRYRLLVDAITDYAIFMLDANGMVTSWNTGAERFKGYQTAEILGQHFSRFYTEEDRTKGLPELGLRTAEVEGRFEGEGWRVRKDGTRFWAHVLIDSIREPTGRLVGYAKIIRDLTGRRRAEELLRKSQEQFRLLVQGVTDYAIFMLDPAGRVSSWNMGAQRIKGYLPEEIIGEHFSRFYTEEDRARGEPEKALATAAREGRFEKEAQRVRKDGTRFWAHVVIDPIRDDGGQLIGFAKVTRDITERKEAQRALEEAREALFQSQKMEAIGQLTGGIAHDFNNLLMAVIVSLEFLRKRMPQDPALLRLLDNALQGAHRGASLTQRMLTFARRQALNYTAVDVPSLVRGMTDLIQRSIGPLVMIETRFPLDLPRVQTDENQLETALLNLVVNARDAMPEGGQVIIAAREEIVGSHNSARLKPGRYVCLAVQDTGMGMDEETLARAMDPFFTTKGVGKGTGLGLSMVQGLAEQSGGRLVLVSEKNVGTTAELWLPVAETYEQGLAARLAVPGEAESRKPSALVILAVDDDGLVLMSTSAMLEDLGHEVIEAASGAEALETLRSNKRVDLVITDQVMPQMTGTQLAAAIRAEWPDLPVIIATGYAELPEDVAAVLPKLSKPFRQDDLSRIIAEVMPA
ncbi:hybrid sensor histidine kinase/response regulator [Rhodoligotrophos defluvii]|uniref:hybrid sensor histidine kinase/response regulator n=1 Tax=Rhodoligotrophos defluvii TaxID=2561934 RepID=UPI0010C9E93B|nr:PAS domain-containing sensor histidine kinase [Rhodoligotrophos defluvii]